MFNYSDKNLLVARRGKTEKNIIWLITAINKDNCTSKNYTNLISRLDNHIKNFDDLSVYEWK
jgi:hypothetical protein